jgi:biotin carboxylase
LLLEQFIEGVEVGGEAFFFDEVLLMLFITNKAITPPPYYVPYGHSLPSGLDSGIQNEIRNVVYKGSRALGIKLGPVNFDVMITSKGPVIIELGARLGGTCLPSIVRYHSGIDTVEAALMVAMGQNPSDLFQRNKSLPVAVRLIKSDRDGILTKARFPHEIDKRPEVLEYTVDIEEGGHVKAFTCGANRFGHVICQGVDYSNAERNANEILKASDFEIMPV